MSICAGRSNAFVDVWIKEMNNHLSQDQFEECVSGKAGPPELEHLSHCAECRAEVERFRSGIALFRRAVQDMAESATVVHAARGIPEWSWALAAAALVAAIVLPFFISRPKPTANTEAGLSPEAVMERLNRHLAGTVPEPMEPMFSLISVEPPGGEGDRTQ